MKGSLVAVEDSQLSRVDLEEFKATEITNIVMTAAVVKNPRAYVYLSADIHKLKDRKFM